MAQRSVAKLYQSIIDDVIVNVRDLFVDDGIDEQVLTELKQIWEKKMEESKVLAEPTLVVHPRTQSSHQQSSQAAPSTVGNLPANPVASSDLQGAGIPRHTFTIPARLAHAGLQNLIASQPSHNLVPTQASQNLTTQPTHNLVTNSSGHTTLQLLQGNVFQMSSQPAPVQHGGPQISGIECKLISTGQLQGVTQYSVAIPVSALQSGNIKQLDGANETSDEEDSVDEEIEEEDEESKEEDDPLNSDDDDDDDESDTDPETLNSDNVVVCQYDKISRCKNRWKFHLKDGIMHLKGRDYIFQRAMGDSEW